ncbi:DUF481 domain-containing protein [Spirosoma sp. SC4-14]|uniref:DUF481 domain-containing protein n=1 Tax=Spirosoma sp. SC4-14 TaxID=3128900 RepID=UPI0030CD52F4
MTRLIFLLCLIASSALAQLNESDTARFQLRASLTGNFQQGNVEVTTVRGKLDLVTSPVRSWVFKSQNSSLYQSFYSAKADNDLFSRNYLYYRPERRIYPFAIAYVSTNYRRKIDLRYFAGAGATLQLICKPQNVLKLSAGTVYENTRFSADTYNEAHYNGSQLIDLWRGTVWLGGWHYLLDNHLRLYYDAYYQPTFSDTNNYRWQYDIGFDFPIWRGLAFNALYTYTHENVVVTNIYPDDKILTVGLSYTLRKLQGR